MTQGLRLDQPGLSFLEKLKSHQVTPDHPEREGGRCEFSLCNLSAPTCRHRQALNLSFTELQSCSSVYPLVIGVVIFCTQSLAFSHGRYS